MFRLLLRILGLVGRVFLGLLGIRLGGRDQGDGYRPPPADPDRDARLLQFAGRVEPSMRRWLQQAVDEPRTRRGHYARRLSELDGVWFGEFEDGNAAYGGWGKFETDLERVEGLEEAAQLAYAHWVESQD